MNMHISLPSVIRRKSIPAGLLALLAAGCVPDSETQVTIENPLPSDRVNEIVEIPLSALGQEAGQENGSTLVITDGRGKQVPSQITFDGKLIFPASVKAGSSARYQIRKGNPDTLSVIACGRHYPERMDDIAWENDKAAYRAYGPALEASGERAWGYDVFTKSVSEPVVEMRYARELDPQARAQISAWRKEGRKEQADSLAQAISYHVDHGNGMDCYSVGPTLGGGTAVPMTADSMLIYPRCYKEYEILDNGPLRFTVRLKYAPFTAGSDTSVVETRLISLDCGSHLNRTEVSYGGLRQSLPVASGIVIHPQNPDGYVCQPDKGYVAYADSTDNPHGNNGIIYLGMVFPQPLAHAAPQWFTPDERKQHGGALGHVLGIGTYQPDSTWTYYWGSGWSKAGIGSMEQWNACLEDFAKKLQAPLRITVE